MPARFVNVEHDTPLLLPPPDLRAWVPRDHLVHFLMDAVGELALHGARVNERGTGEEQYPPRLMLGLLIYRCATGIFASRQIERATYEHVAVRLLCADTHPDPDTICTFRRVHRELPARSFAQVLELSAQCGVLKVGGITVAIEGTKVLASERKPAPRSNARNTSANSPPVTRREPLGKNPAARNRSRPAPHQDQRIKSTHPASLRAGFYRPGKPDHAGERRRLRAVLQRASRRGSREPVDRRPAGERRAQRQRATRAEPWGRRRRGWPRG
jgi:transposase